MSEMVKRVAMVLYQEDGMKHASPNVTVEQSWDLSPVYHDKYLSKARAAIEAMREPTLEMVEVGTDVAGWIGVEYKTRDTYQAMIDAAKTP